MPNNQFAPRPSLTGSQSGFSLIEIMVVLIIIGLFLTFGASKFVNRSTDMKASVRRFSATIKQLRNRARLENKTYRLVFDLPLEKNKPQSYWVESTQNKALLLSAEKRKELSAALEEALRKAGQLKDDSPPPDPQGFALDQSVIKDAPAQLPRGLFFESIEIDGQEIERIEAGRVYIYFFPQGYVQAGAIHLTNRAKLGWTLMIEGLTGRVIIYPKITRLQDLKQS